MVQAVMIAGLIVHTYGRVQEADDGPVIGGSRRVNEIEEAAFAAVRPLAVGRELAGWEREAVSMAQRFLCMQRYKIFCKCANFSIKNYKFRIKNY